MSVADRVMELERENAQLNADLALLTADHAALKQQLDWFKRQLFGSKSEKRLDVDPAVQGNLLSALGVATRHRRKTNPKRLSPTSVARRPVMVPSMTQVCVLVRTYRGRLLRSKTQRSRPYRKTSAN